MGITGWLGAARRTRFAAVLIAVVACSLLMAAVAQAGTVIVGSPLTGTFVASNSGLSVTLTNSALPEPGANVTSPVTGLITQWRVKAFTGQFALRVLTPGAGMYTGTGIASAPQMTNGGDQTFFTSLPIKAGQTIALDETGAAGDKTGVLSTPGAFDLVWNPPLGATEERAPTGSNADLEFGFQATVVPAPIVSSLAPASGPISGGTTVAIAGHDFDGATAVRFGTTPAKSYTIDSESRITAISPSVPSPGPVDVTVTSFVGSSTTVSEDKFTYQACVVPNLKRKKLKAAKRALRNADCGVGKVRGNRKGSKVKKQSVTPGTALPPGSDVNLKMNATH